MENLKEQYDINFINNNQVQAHLTLCTGKINPEKIPFLETNLKLYLQKTSSFYLSTKGLGLFLSEHVNLHIRWKETNELHALKLGIENSLSKIWIEDEVSNDLHHWLAKTSLAFKDINYLNMGRIRFDKLGFNDTDMLVKELAIVRFNAGEDEQIINKLYI